VQLHNVSYYCAASISLAIAVFVYF